MFLKHIIRKMRHSSKNLANGLTNASQEAAYADYESAVRTLNSLQSNADYIRLAQQKKLSHAEEHAKTILQVQKYLIRSGISLQTLDSLPVIHVAGTKGKGMTCALCESILRHHGLRTGFYSSPHLMEVRERIRINGVPLKKQEFAHNFWQVYNKLDREKNSPNDMPMYFKFLTVMAFRVFLMEKVDVAIVEVGIGGEYDSTNVLRKVPVVGITSLGLDHTRILGDTLEKIAWHKSGISKTGSQVFTVPQPAAAMKVITDRCTERNCSLEIVNLHLNQSVQGKYQGAAHIFNQNASLAIALAQAWINLKEKSHFDIVNSEATKLGLLECVWPGRYHVINSSTNVYYLDGAHTSESIQTCAQWFVEQTRQLSHKKVLIFNATGDRNSEDLMEKLRMCCFHQVYFVPNRATLNDAEDNKNIGTEDDNQMKRCYVHYDVWLKLERINNTYPEAKFVKVMPSVSDVLQECSSCKSCILITGSLHLVGAALSIINLEKKS